MTDRAHTRHTDPETSHVAAASVKDLSGKQGLVLNVLKMHGPMTDERLTTQYCAMLGMSESGARSRRAELVDRRLVRDTGRKGETKCGRPTTIWEAV